MIMQKLDDRWVDYERSLQQTGRLDPSTRRPS